MFFSIRIKIRLKVSFFFQIYQRKRKLFSQKYFNQKYNLIRKVIYTSVLSFCILKEIKLIQFWQRFIAKEKASCLYFLGHVTKSIIIIKYYTDIKRLCFHFSHLSKFKLQCREYIQSFTLKYFLSYIVIYFKSLGEWLATLKVLVQSHWCNFFSIKTIRDLLLTYPQKVYCLSFFLNRCRVKVKGILRKKNNYYFIKFKLWLQSELLCRFFFYF